MATLYANQFVNIRVKDAEGNQSFKRKALFSFWMEHPDRPTGRGITMDHSGERFVEGRLNLWRGFGVEPKPGDWPLLRRHITDVLCSGDTEHASYMGRWIAWRVQNPTLGTGGTGPTGTATAIISVREPDLESAQGIEMK